MDFYTIDASVVIKWVSRQREQQLVKARDLYKQAVEGKIKLVAPSLLQVEVSNILLKKKKLKPNTIVKLWQLINEEMILYVDLSETILKKSLSLAEKHDLSVYDGLYLAIAHESKTKLISADVKGHGKIGVVVLLENW